MKQLRQYIRRLLKEQTRDEFETPGDEEALENYELAEKIILAFLRSANQGIELIQYHPDPETVSVLGDIFSTVRDDIRSFTEVDPAQFKGKMTDQLVYGTKVDNTLKELRGWDIFHMAGWEDWMPRPKDAEGLVEKFAGDIYDAFRSKWFVNTPEEKQQEWLDWLGGDL